MFIVFRGWGILSVGIAVACGFIFAWLGNLFPTVPHSNPVRYGVALGLGVGAVVNWFVGRSLNQNMREANVNVLKRHSLFFLPMEYWSLAMVLGSIFFLSIARE
jgi:hypothetical protein